MYLISNFNFLQPTIEGEWTPWTNKVPPIEVETHRVGAPDVVVPTLDTVRHENILYRYLNCLLFVLFVSALCAFLCFKSVLLFSGCGSYPRSLDTYFPLFICLLERLLFLIEILNLKYLLLSWLAEHKPLVLCGPPGSGKTMTLFSALRCLPDMEVSSCFCDVT